MTATNYFPLSKKTYHYEFPMVVVSSLRIMCGVPNDTRPSRRVRQQGGHETAEPNFNVLKFKFLTRLSFIPMEIL